MPKPVLLAALLLACACLPHAREARAEALGPGKYTGWVVQDRWGEVHLANGIFLLPFRGKARAAALRWRGKPVTVDVAEVSGDGDEDQAIARVNGFEAATPAHAGKLTLEMQEPEDCPPNPRRWEFPLFLRYQGGEKVEFDPRFLKVLVRRRGAPLPDDATRRGPLFRAANERGTPWHAGGWSMLVLEQGTLTHHEQAFRAFGGRLETAGAFTWRTDLYTTLVPGQYEVFAAYGDANFSKAPAPRTRMWRFDVPAGKKQPAEAK